MEGLFGVSWVWWLLGTFGIAGTIALAILAPTVLGMVWKLVLTAIEAMLRTRIGVAVLVACVVFVVADIHRSRLDQAELEQQKAEFEAAQKARDAKIAADTKAAVDEAVAKQQADDAQVDKDVKDFNNALPPVPATGNPFAVGPDACRLRTIAGLPCSQPEGKPDSVPPAHPANKRTKHR